MRPFSRTTQEKRRTVAEGLEPSAHSTTSMLGLKAPWGSAASMGNDPLKRYRVSEEVEKERFRVTEGRVVAARRCRRQGLEETDSIFVESWISNEKL